MAMSTSERNNIIRSMPKASPDEVIEHLRKLGVAVTLKAIRSVRSNAQQKAKRERERTGVLVRRTPDTKTRATPLRTTDEAISSFTNDLLALVQEHTRVTALELVTAALSRQQHST